MPWNSQNSEVVAAQTVEPLTLTSYPVTGEPPSAVGADHEVIKSSPVTVKVSCDGDSGTEKLVCIPLAVFAFEATVLVLVIVTIATLYPAGAFETPCELELLEGDGELIDARRNETRALAVVAVGVGVGVTVWFKMF
jgi:hypothetical protein